MGLLADSTTEDDRAVIDFQPGRLGVLTQLIELPTRKLEAERCDLETPLIAECAIRPSRDVWSLTEDVLQDAAIPVMSFPLVWSPQSVRVHWWNPDMLTVRTLSQTKLRRPDQGTTDQSLSRSSHLLKSSQIFRNL